VAGAWDQRGRAPVLEAATPKPHELPEQPREKINTTDPDSRNVKTPRSYTQGCNAQAVGGEPQDRARRRGDHQLAGLRTLAADGQSHQRRNWKRSVSARRPQVAVADTGYWHEDQIDNVISNGTQVLIPPDAGKRDTPRPGWQGRALRLDAQCARKRLRRAGSTEDARRHTKRNRRIDRFQRRGRSAARSGWRLIIATHNLMKLHKHQIAAAGPESATGRPEAPSGMKNSIATTAITVISIPASLAAALMCDIHRRQRM
jgi:hypothetical protein